MQEPVITAGQDAPAVRKNRHRVPVNRPFLVPERADQPAGVEVPENQLAVFAAGKPPSVGQKRNRRDRADVQLRHW